MHRVKYFLTFIAKDVCFIWANLDGEKFNRVDLQLDGAETYICRNMFRIRQCQNLVLELSLICRNPKPETNAESRN